MRGVGGLPMCSSKGPKGMVETVDIPDEITLGVGARFHPSGALFITTREGQVGD